MGVMVMALGFATVTVEEASTVHTTLQAAQMTPFNVVVSDVNAGGVLDRDFTLDCTTDCIITGASITVTATDVTGNIIMLSNCEIDGIEILIADLADVANQVASVVPITDAAATDNDEIIEQFFSSTTAITTVDLAILTTTNEPIDVMAYCGTGSNGDFDAGIGPQTAGTRDFVVEYDPIVNGVTSTIEVVFQGFMVGTTEPTGAVGVDA